MTDGHGCLLARMYPDVLTTIGSDFSDPDLIGIGAAVTHRPLQKGPWPGRDTKDHGRCRRYCWPVAVEPPVLTKPPGDGAVFSTAATEPLVGATGPNE